MSMDYEMWFSGESALTKVVLPDFMQSASNYMQTMPGAEPGMTPFSGGMGGALDIQGTIYVDYEQGIVEYPAPSFMAEPYVVSSKLEPLNWTISEQDSTILGYAVQYATASLDTLKAAAWYAPELASPAGPMTFGGLPGVVLHLVAEISSFGSTVQFELVADSISTAISAPVAPPTGVRISPEDYQAIVMKRLEGMQKQLEERFKRRESQQ